VQWQRLVCLQTPSQVWSVLMESMVQSLSTGPPQGLNGNLYGTTSYGGTSIYGTVFKISPTGNLTSVHSFGGGASGAYPQGDWFKPTMASSTVRLKRAEPAALARSSKSIRQARWPRFIASAALMAHTLAQAWCTRHRRHAIRDNRVRVVPTTRDGLQFHQSGCVNHAS
jgi:uncharacterized repeat protein (TIGR03803 family)